MVITDNDHIRELNQLYRGIDAPTNVLSFSMLEGEFGSIGNLLGDLVISAERAEEEGHDSGITTDERMSQLLVHGILHLVGYDHDNDESDSVNSNSGDNYFEDKYSDEEDFDRENSKEKGYMEMEKKSLELLRLIEPNKELDFF